MSNLPTASDTQPSHYSIPELAAELRVSVEFVRTQANTGKWPHLRLGERTVSFTAAHLAQIEAMSEKRPATRTAPATTRKRRKAVSSMLRAV